MKRVLCDAVVDRVGEDNGGQFASYLVTVDGRMDHAGKQRVYALNAETEDEAAKTGIRRFVEEMGGDL